MIHPRHRISTWSLDDKRFPYDARFDGGGIYFAPFLLRYLNRNSLHFEYAVEACAGLGFIGLSLLHNEFVERLLLTDINPEVRALVDFEDYMLTDMLDGVEGPVDLIVGNLPYFPSVEAFKAVAKLADIDERIYLDKDWSLHQKLFTQARNILSSKGLLVFFGYEDILASVDYFRPEGFILRDVIPCWEKRQMVVLEKL